MSGFAVRDALAEVNGDGKFVRVASGFREIISESHPVYKPEAGRYHLYISYACPWANRCLVMAKLKGLLDYNIINFTAVHPTWQKTKPNDPNDRHFGWAFYDSSANPPVVLTNPSGYGRFVIAGCSPDPNNTSVQFIRDLYELSNDTIKKFTVPVLWDKKTNTIVNNESSEIMRIFNSTFNHLLPSSASSTELPYLHHDFYPVELQSTINEMNEFVYSNINDGVYKCGFAKTQLAYDEAISNLYSALDKVEAILSKQRYLTSSTIVTEADIRLFMTLIRFDEVYIVYFKCNWKILLYDYPMITSYMKELYQIIGMKECIDMNHIKTHYFTSHPTLNAYAIIPKGPNVLAQMELPHNRHDLK